MKILQVFLVLALVSMLLVAGCSKTATTTGDGADSPAAELTPEAQADEVIDTSLVDDADEVELGSLV